MKLLSHEVELSSHPVKLNSAATLLWSMHFHSQLRWIWHIAEIWRTRNLVVYKGYEVHNADGRLEVQKEVWVSLDADFDCLSEEND